MGQRVFLAKPGRSKPSRKIVLVEPPFVQQGDIVAFEGEPWSVIEVEATQIIATIAVLKKAEHPLVGE